MSDKSELELLGVAKAEKWHILEVLLNGISLFGFNINECDLDGNTILHILAEKNVDLLEKAIERDGKINVNFANKKGKTALHISAENGNLRAVRALVQIKADQNIKDLLGETPIFKAIRNGCIEIVKYLINSGSFVFATNRDGSNLLHLAAENDNLVEICKLLLKNGIKINYLNNFGYSPLHVAVIQGSSDTAKLLIENGATIDLHVAVQAKQIEMVKALIKREIDVNNKNTDGETALHLAIQNESLEISKVLLESGAGVNLTDRDDYSPLHLASKINNLEFSSLLISHGASPNFRTFNGDSPIHLAASVGNLKIVNYLLNNKLNDVHIVNNDGSTPLHLAWENGHLQIVNTLIVHGANVNMCNKFNRTCKTKYGTTIAKRRNTLSQ